MNRRQRMKYRKRASHRVQPYPLGAWRCSVRTYYPMIPMSHPESRRAVARLRRWLRVGLGRGAFGADSQVVAAQVARDLYIEAHTSAPSWRGQYYSTHPRFQR